jgi:glycosyltransferase involved in cell wall biosynthesis
LSKPFVSVLVDTYNQERFIEQAIVSVLEQDFPAADREILVVDDGSTDRTPEIVRNFEPRVRLLRKTNGGQASAFNAGIPECQGEIVAFLDGDDWWAPGKLRRVVEVLAASANCRIVGHGIFNSFEDGAESVDAPEKSERLRLYSTATAKIFRLRKSYLGTSRMTVRAEILRRILPVPEALVIEADEYIFTLAAALGDVVILRDVLAHYRQHGANLYNAAGGSSVGLRRKQRVMSALAEALRRELRLRNVPADAVECVCEIIEAEAEQMRLMLDGGMPWQTLQTENTIYRVMYADPPYFYRVFRAATMIPALLLPPRWFYAGRRWLGGRNWYRRARQNALPVPTTTRLARPADSKP